MSNLNIDKDKHAKIYGFFANVDVTIRMVSKASGA